MQDSVLNLVRVKMRDHQRLQHGPLSEYPTKTFGKAVPRSGNASGGGHPGTALRCKPGGQTITSMWSSSPKSGTACCR